MGDREMEQISARVRHSERQAVSQNCRYRAHPEDELKNLKLNLLINFHVCPTPSKISIQNVQFSCPFKIHMQNLPFKNPWANSSVHTWILKVESTLLSAHLNKYSPC